MNTERITKYCQKRCEEEFCSTCKFKDYEFCKVNFVFELCDIIDTKTLEFNNVRGILIDLDNLFCETKNIQKRISSKSTEYAISELFSINRYKITKKINCDELIKNKED